LAVLRRSLLVLPLPLLLLLPVAPAPAWAAEQPRGVDVSAYQHPHGAVIDWAQLRAAGLSFVYAKATEGTDRTNPWFADDVPRARANGFAAGAYHFARPTLPLSTAVDQADFFARTIGDQLHVGALPPVLDLESTGGLNRGDLTAWAQLFLDRLHDRTGRTPAVYSYPNFLRSAVYGPALHDAHLWIATYGGPVASPVPGDWPAYDVWQTSDTGSYPGVAARVDTDVFAGTPEQLANFADGTAPQTWPSEAATAPYGVSLTPRTRGTLTLQWIPAADGGNPVTSWALSLSDGTTRTLPATSTTAVLTGLDPAVTYRATLHAETSAGAGADNISNGLAPLGPTSLSITPGTTTYGGPVTTTGRLTSVGVPLAGATVRVEQRLGSARSTVATVTTAADGTWRWSSRATANAVLRAAFDQAGDYASGVSAEALQKVLPAMTTSAASRVRAGATWIVTATVRPGEDRVVRLLVLTGGRFQVAWTAHPDSAGRVRLLWRGAQVGNRTARVQVGAGATTVGLLRRVDVRVVG
jgi:GH25 family lysozyme M1 (1,4-beta-N-acetylmuramidase)/5-hydroxyisourate hydrolase-like protein (transthyretin family)